MKPCLNCWLIVSKIEAYNIQKQKAESRKQKTEKAQLLSRDEHKGGKEQTQKTYWIEAYRGSD